MQELQEAYIQAARKKEFETLRNVENCCTLWEKAIIAKTSTQTQHQKTISLDMSNFIASKFRENFDTPTLEKGFTQTIGSTTLEVRLLLIYIPSTSIMFLG